MLFSACPRVSNPDQSLQETIAANTIMVHKCDIQPQCLIQKANLHMQGSQLSLNLDSLQGWGTTKFSQHLCLPFHRSHSQPMPAIWRRRMVCLLKRGY